MIESGESSGPVVNSDLAEVLSPSQVRCFMECPTRWWFKYGFRHPDPSAGSLALGRAVHSTLGHNFAQKVETYEDLPIAGVLVLFREAWAMERDQAEFRDDENPAEPRPLAKRWSRSIWTRSRHSSNPLRSSFVWRGKSAE